MKDICQISFGRRKALPSLPPKLSPFFLSNFFTQQILIESLVFDRYLGIIDNTEIALYLLNYVYPEALDIIQLFTCEKISDAGLE